MARKYSKFQLRQLYKKACKDFVKGFDNYIEISKKYKISRQLASEWHKRWRVETFDSVTNIEVIQEEIVSLREPSVSKVKINKSMQGLELHKANVSETLEILRQNIERAALKERDPSKISKAYTDLAQYVMDSNEDKDNKKNTNNFFMEQFQLHQTVNQIGNNGQSKKSIPSRDQKE